MMTKAAAVVEDVEVAAGLVEGIRTHCLRERDKGGYEAVGFVAKLRDSDIITTLVRLNNHSPDPQHAYFVEPWEQFRAEKALRKAGYVIVGVYHSHITGEAFPSRTDHVAARPGELMFIYSVAFDDLKAWRQLNGSLFPVVVSARAPHD